MTIDPQYILANVMSQINLQHLAMSYIIDQPVLVLVLKNQLSENVKIWMIAFFTAKHKSSSNQPSTSSASSTLCSSVQSHEYWLLKMVFKLAPLPTHFSIYILQWHNMFGLKQMTRTLLTKFMRKSELTGVHCANSLPLNKLSANLVSEEGIIKTYLHSDMAELFIF